MRYKDIKIVERDLNKVASEIVMPIEKYFKKDCNDENRINQQLTNLRKNLAKYPEKRNPVIQRLGRSFPVLAKLVKGTVYPIQIARSGFSMPEYKKEMCSGGVADSGTGTKDGTGITGGKDGTGNKDGIGNKDGSTGQTINDKFGTEMQTFGEFLDSNDLEGALAFLDGNPEFETAIGSKFRTDIQSALDAQEAKESNRLAQEKAAKEAKEAKEKADAAAAKEAKEKADAAAEAKRIAAEEEQARLDAIEAEAEAARIEQEEEAARLEKEAEDARIAAEKLEKERIEAEAEAQRIADQEETDDNSEGVEEFEWEELQ